MAMTTRPPFASRASFWRQTARAYVNRFDRLPVPQRLRPLQNSVRGLVEDVLRKAGDWVDGRRERAWQKRRYRHRTDGYRLQLEALEDRQLLSVTPLGTEFRVNTFLADAQQTFFQTPKAVAVDASGDY